MHETKCILFLLSLLLVFSRSFVSNSFQAHALQHTRPSCSSPSLGVCPSSYSLHWWCHPAISSSDALFSFCPQSFPASGTFPMSQLFVSDDQNTGASALASILPMYIQDWFPLGSAVLICCSPRYSQESSPTHSSKASILWHSAFFPIHSHIHTWPLEKP